jgi:hypothetical protein
MTGNTPYKSSPVVSVVTKNGESKEEQIGSTESDSTLCNVGYTAARTINLGDYNSLKVSVSLHIPCTHSEIDEIFNFATQWVNERMGALVEECDGDE